MRDLGKYKFKCKFKYKFKSKNIAMFNNLFRLFNAIILKNSLINLVNKLMLIKLKAINTISSFSKTLKDKR
ncbi:hypothetical protein CCORG_1370 [Campylobacter corcagiensis]|nr:hypothetical protein CCORG_1370 [Campylobacter corcagiensis]